MVELLAFTHKLTPKREVQWYQVPRSRWLIDFVVLGGYAPGIPSVQNAHHTVTFCGCTPFYKLPLDVHHSISWNSANWRNYWIENGLLDEEDSCAQCQIEMFGLLPTFFPHESNVISWTPSTRTHWLLNIHHRTTFLEFLHNFANSTLCWSSMLAEKITKRIKFLFVLNIHFHNKLQ